MVEYTNHTNNNRPAPNTYSNLIYFKRAEVKQCPYDGKLRVLIDNFEQWVDSIEIEIPPDVTKRLGIESGDLLCGYVTPEGHQMLNDFNTIRVYKNFNTPTPD